MVWRNSREAENRQIPSSRACLVANFPSTQFPDYSNFHLKASPQMWCRPIFHRKAESVLDTFAPNFASILPPTKYINPFKFSVPFPSISNFPVYSIPSKKFLPTKPNQRGPKGWCNLFYDIYALRILVDRVVCKRIKRNRREWYIWFICANYREQCYYRSDMIILKKRNRVQIQWHDVLLIDQKIIKIPSFMPHLVSLSE